MKHYKMLLLVAAIITVLGMTQSAYAGVFTLTLTQGASTVTVTDTDLDGVITFSGVVGVFAVNVTTGLSKPFEPSGPGFGYMDLNSVNASTASGTLVIKLSDTDFPGGGPGGTLLGEVGGTTQGSAEFWGYKDPSNTLFGTSGALSVHMGPFTGGAFSGTDTFAHAPLAEPYSMTLVAEITHGTGTKNTSFDFSLQNNVIPEPSSLLLIGTGLLGLGIVARRKFRG